VFARVRLFVACMVDSPTAEDTSLLFVQSDVDSTRAQRTPFNRLVVDIKRCRKVDVADTGVGETEVQFLRANGHEAMVSVLQEATFEVSMAAEAWLEMLHMHFAGILLDSLTSIAAAESELRAAERAEDELRRQCAPLRFCFGASAAPL
jgi:hypothetical protein